MTKKLIIRQYEEKDKDEVIKLWGLCNLLFPGNDPETDIKLKVSFQGELFFVGELDNKIVATLMVGYDGHRGWLNYLGVHPDFQKKGLGSAMVQKAIETLKSMNCPKINLQVRKTNTGVMDFYKKLGFREHEVVSMQLKL